ncbi:MAG: hypothetical protein AB3N64_14635 [Puniceicoccaceae bacterium]
MKFPYRAIFPAGILAALVLSGAGLFAADLEDWTLDDVLAKVSEANGGDKALKSVISARFLGEVENPNDSYDFVLLKKRPDKLRMHLRFFQRSIERGFDGDHGWVRLTQHGRDKVFPVEGDELVKMRIESDFDGPLVGSGSENVERRLLGIERIERIDYFVIEVETPFSLAHHYVDSRTFRELKNFKWQKPVDDKSQKTVSYFYENQRHSQIWVAHRVERVLADGSKEVIRINQVEINPGLLDRTFDEPAETNPLPKN